MFVCTGTMLPLITFHQFPSPVLSALVDFISLLYLMIDPQAVLKEADDLDVGAACWVKLCGEIASLEGHPASLQVYHCKDRPGSQSPVVVTATLVALWYLNTSACFLKNAPDSSFFKDAISQCQCQWFLCEFDFGSGRKYMSYFVSTAHEQSGKGGLYNLQLLQRHYPTDVIRQYHAV